MHLQERRVHKSEERKLERGSAARSHHASTSVRCVRQHRNLLFQEVLADVEKEARHPSCQSARHLVAAAACLVPLGRLKPSCARAAISIGLQLTVELEPHAFEERGLDGAHVRTHEPQRALGPALLCDVKLVEVHDSG